MLQRSLTKSFMSMERDIDPNTVANIIEGCALKNVFLSGVTGAYQTNISSGYPGGNFVLAPTTGVATEIFAGVAFSPRRLITQITTVIDIPVTVAGAVDSGIVPANTPANNTNVGGIVGAASANVVVVAPVAALDVQVSLSATGTLVFTFAATAIGTVFQMSFRRNITALQSQQIFGDYLPVQAPDATSRVSVLQKGEVWTDQFDPLFNWTTSTSLKAIAGGLFTGNTSTLVGIAVTNAKLISIPTSSIGYLGFVLE